MRQPEFERQLIARPKPLSSSPLGALLALEGGVISVDPSPPCELEAGDLVTKLSWSVRGYRRLNGGCDAGEPCFKKLKRSQTQARKRRARLSLSLTYERWPLDQRASARPSELKARCVLP